MYSWHLFRGREEIRAEFDLADAEAAIDDALAYVERHEELDEPLTIEVLRHDPEEDPDCEWMRCRAPVVRRLEL